MLEKLKTKLTEKANNVVNRIVVPDEVREERLKICMSCDRLVPKINMCNTCGCIVHAKTWVANTACPIKKWDIHPH